MSHTPPVLAFRWRSRPLLPLGSSGNVAALQHEEGWPGAAGKVLWGPREEGEPGGLRAAAAGAQGSGGGEARGSARRARGPAGRGRPGVAGVPEPA